MIDFDTAFQRMMQHARTLGTEQIPLSEAVGRILAQPVRADIDLPPFNRAAMDGFACHRADLALPLRQVGTVGAGMCHEAALQRGECVRIMTGAPLPEQADCVFMLEESAVDSAAQVRFTGKNSPDNFVPQGDDLRQGDLLLSPGERLQAAHLASLAAVGLSHPTVFIRPQVAIITTGDELVGIDQRPEGAQIRNSNAPQLFAQVAAAGGVPKDFGHVGDALPAIRERVAEATRAHDVVLLSGGVSMGDFDYGREALEASGYQFAFDRVAMQPGKPTLFGFQSGLPQGNRWCFGLPGNPVSTFMVFERMVKPFLYGLMGHIYQPRLISAQLGGALKRKKVDREAAFPVCFTDPSTVTPLSYHGSAHINALMTADAFLTLPQGCAGYAEGDRVTVQLFDPLCG